MRQLVVTLLRSLPLLLDVGVLVFFLFFLFGLVGVQLFAGTLDRRCAVLENPNAGCELCGSNATHAAFAGCDASCALPERPRWSTPDDPEELCGGPRLGQYPARDAYEPSGHRRHGGVLRGLREESQLRDHELRRRAERVADDFSASLRRWTDDVWCGRGSPWGGSTSSR